MIMELYGAFNDLLISAGISAWQAICLGLLLSTVFSDGLTKGIQMLMFGAGIAVCLIWLPLNLAEELGGPMGMVVGLLAGLLSLMLYFGLLDKLWPQMNEEYE